MEAQHAAVVAFIAEPERLELRLEPGQPMLLRSLISRVKASRPRALADWA